MSKRKKSNPLVSFIICIIGLIIGFAGGVVGYTYATLPPTEILTIGEEIYYSYSDTEDISSVQLTGASDELSIHFLELGNKYTGDCTYIKYGDIDILIDCGSKSNSIATVSSYLNKYMTDNTLEYVIVTHAHQDHYAGFATTSKVKSIFDIYECETIIDFGSATNQKATATMYNNYLRELNEEIDRGAVHYSAIDCYNNTNGASREFILDETNELKFEILYNYYSEYDRDLTDTTHKASTENNYSVCILLTYGDKHYLFTGDLEDSGEQMLVENNALPEIDLYKAGHHGSKTSSTDELLSVIKPKVVCVCCCAGSPEYTKTKVNQFPTQEFIDRVSKYTDKIYVTTLCVDWEKDLFTSMNGNIVIVTYKASEQVGINCSNNTIKLKDTDWFKSNRVWTISKGE